MLLDKIYDAKHVFLKYVQYFRGKKVRLYNFDQSIVNGLNNIKS